MTQYVVQLEGDSSSFPTSIIIIEREMYENDMGSIENKQNLKIVGEYPSGLKEKLVTILGNPVTIGLESEIFIVKKPFEKCILKMFENL